MSLRALVASCVAFAVAVPVALAAGSAESIPKRVLATANIFGAGYAAPPAPEGGGAGTLPAGWRLAPGSARVVTFPRVTGTVTPIAGIASENGPGGDRVGPTNVESWQGISGVVHGRNGMFLVGVFVGDAEPSAPAPPRLDFTNGERFDTLAPLLGQTFFIGDGGGRRFVAPDEATRVYVGFADSSAYVGRPGFYGNNAGSLEVVAAGVLDGADSRVDVTPPTVTRPTTTTVTASRRATRTRVRYFVSAWDDVDGNLPVTCAPRSGGLFKIGRTVVRCSATDLSGNIGRSQFTVVVRKKTVT